MFCWSYNKFSKWLLDKNEFQITMLRDMGELEGSLCYWVIAGHLGIFLGSSASF